MSAVPTEPPAWSPARRWLLILLVFLAHIGLIFALSDRKPFTPRRPAPAPVLKLANAENELLALNDPTLFALPHRRSFAGAAWLKSPELKFAPARVTEPLRLLPLPVEALGAAFTQFMQTNAFAVLAFETKPAPEVSVPVALEIGAPAPTNSSLRIVGKLASRRLLNPPELKSYTAADLLTNTVAQVWVNADGQVFSATLLTSSTLPEADQEALKIARTARFEPVRQTPTALTLGLLIFEWRNQSPSAAAKPAP